MAAHGFAGLPRFLGSSEGAHFCELLRGDGMYRSGTMRFFVSLRNPDVNFWHSVSVKWFESID